MSFSAPTGHFEKSSFPLAIAIGRAETAILTVCWFLAPPHTWLAVSLGRTASSQDTSPAWMTTVHQCHFVESENKKNKMQKASRILARRLRASRANIRQVANGKDDFSTCPLGLKNIPAWSAGPGECRYGFRILL